MSQIGQTKTNWDDLRIFLAVARHSNLDAASASLHLNATTLGRRLKRLETSLGVTLFDRSRRGHLLTSNGEWMLGQAEQMEQTVADIGEAIAGEVKQLTGTVRLSVTEAFGNVVIAPALGKFFLEHPDLNIELVATSGFLSVSKREADMAVLLSRPTRGRLRVQRLTDYRLRLYATPEYLASNAKITKVSDLHEHKLIGYVDDLIYSPSLRYYDEISPGLTPTLTSSSLLAQKQLTCSHCGIAMLPQFVGDKSAELALVLPHLVNISRTFWLAVHEDIYEHARIQAVVSFLVETVAREQAAL